MSDEYLSQSRVSHRQMDTPPTIRLTHLMPGQSGTVHAVPPIGTLPALGIRRGKRLRVVSRNIAGGPIVVLVDRRAVAIGREIARQITLRVE